MKTDCKSSGFTLIEALVLVVIVGIVGVAAGIGLQAVAKTPAQTDSLLGVNSVCVSAMEQVRAGLVKSWPMTTWGGASFPSLNLNGTSYSIPSTNVGTTGSPSTGYSTPSSGANPMPLSINSKNYVLTISVDQSDPAGGTSYQTDFVRVQVTCGTETLTAYVMQP
jgi:type II secretory pathway pseudopilin PulG